MKINEYLQSLREEDPEFDKWYGENWLSWTPPKRKVKVFLDRNLPQEFKNEIIGYSKFKAFEEIKESRRPDKDIYNYCYHNDCLLLTLDNDFWDDHTFPLMKSPGLILISTHRDSKSQDYVKALVMFLAQCDLIGGIRRFPEFAKKMKFKISLTGFVHKFVAYDGKPEVIQVQY